MALKKHAALVFSFVAALFLDTAVLPKWNLFSMVPFVMLACMLAAEQVFSRSISHMRLLRQMARTLLSVRDSGMLHRSSSISRLIFSRLTAVTAESRALL